MTESYREQKRGRTGKCLFCHAVISEIKAAKKERIETKLAGRKKSARHVLYLFFFW